MKKIIEFLMLVIITGLIFPLNAQENKTEKKAETIKLTDNIYKITIFGQTTVNMIAFIGEEGIMLVDDGLSQTAEILQAELKTISDKPVKYIANTHFHGDHAGSNPYFGKQGKIIAHRNVLKLLTRGESLLLNLPEEALPSIIIDKEKDMKFNGEKIKFIPFDGSHSSGDMVVFFEKEGIAAVGDLIFSDCFPFIDLNHGGNLDKYISAQDVFLKKFPKNTVFVTGHGRDYKKEDIEKYRDMIKKTSQLVLKEKKSGKTIEEMEKADILKEWDEYSKGFINKNAWIESICTFENNKTNPPKPPVFDTLISILVKKDTKSTIELYKDLKKNHSNEYSFLEQYLNVLGYTLLAKNQVKDAIELFILNVEEYPASSNVYDSLGEGYMMDGNKELSIKNYQKSLELDPKNDNAKKMIEKQK
jgi:cyclase